jgi:hypothetical protein
MAHRQFKIVKVSSFLIVVRTRKSENTYEHPLVLGAKLQFLYDCLGRSLRA